MAELFQDPWTSQLDEDSDSPRLHQQILLGVLSPRVCSTERPGAHS
jgi:hypothetical protein